MALQGTLKDFALPDILQLIGIQRKTGILTMEHGDEVVTVQFFEGQVVGADTKQLKLEDLLGSVLVRTGRITEAQLKEATATQRETLQRLGYILLKSRYISEEDLREALRIQISQIVYRLFRWRDGRYDFRPMDHLEYDRTLVVPVSAESLLMEGARMIDEWPVIERRIRTARTVFRKTPAGIEYEARGSQQPLDDFNIDLLEPEESEAPSGPHADEREIFLLLDGSATVQDIVDRSALGEFDVYRTLHDLLCRNLIEEAPDKGAPRVGERPRSARAVLAKAAIVGVFAAASLALATIGSNPLVPWRLRSAREEIEQLKSHVSQGRIDRIQHAIDMFYLDLGAAPPRLESLALRGYLAEADLRDPWGRPYAYELSPEGYRLIGLEASGEPSGTLRVAHRFSPARRLVLEGLPASGPGPGPPP